MGIFDENISSGLEEALTGIEKQFIMMRSSGASVREISKTLKKSHRTICNWNKKFAKEIIGVRNSEFCDLQKKVIDSKTERHNFLKGEFEKVTKIIKRKKIDVNDYSGDYNKFLDLYVKLADLMSSCESDIMTVGVKFKDNIEPEISQNELEQEKNNETPETVAQSGNIATQNGNIIVEESEEENIDNSKVKPDGKQMVTKCSAVTPKKYEAYKKQRFK